MQITFDLTDAQHRNRVRRILDLEDGPARVEVTLENNVPETAAEAFSAPSAPSLFNEQELGANPAPPPPSEPPETSSPPLPEVDGEGTPWDERIHASTKTRTAKNIWKKRKGIDPRVVAKVLVEINPAVYGTAATFAPSTTTTEPPPPPPPPVSEPLTYQDLLKKFMDSKGAITPEQLAQACSEESISGGFPALVNHPDKVEAVAKRLNLL